MRAYGNLAELIKRMIKSIYNRSLRKNFMGLCPNARNFNLYLNVHDVYNNKTPYIAYLPVKDGNQRVNNTFHLLLLLQPCHEKILSSVFVTRSSQDIEN